MPDGVGRGRIDTVERRAFNQRVSGEISIRIVKMRKATVCASAVVIAAMTTAAHAQPFATARTSQAAYVGGD